MKEELVSNLIALCRDKQVDAELVVRELMDAIGDDELIDYYIAVGPLPEFPKVLVDTFVLGEKCVFDYEIAETETKEKERTLTIIPWASILRISMEKHATFVSVHFNIGDLGGQSLNGRVEDIERLQRFFLKAKTRILRK